MASALDRVRVASPCNVAWSEMHGDARARFCQQCQRHVYNLSEMTSDEAMAFLSQSEGRTCIRLYRRADGTVVTRDCGDATSARRWTRLGWGAAAAAALGFLPLTVRTLSQKEPAEQQDSASSTAPDAHSIAVASDVVKSAQTTAAPEGCGVEQGDCDGFEKPILK